MEHFNGRSNALDSKFEDIIIPRVEIQINPEDSPSIPSYTLNNIELLGYCVCEALKRQQRFSRTLINQRTKEFHDLMQLKHFKIQKCWLHRVLYEYKFKVVNREELLHEKLPVEIDLNEILNYCLSKIRNKRIKEYKYSDYTISFNANQDDMKIVEYPSSEDVQITSYSDVLKILRPIKNLAALSDNSESLELIYELENHIRNK